MQDQKQYILRYTMFWSWALVVTAGVWYAYDAVLQALPDLLARLLRIDHIVSNADADADIWRVLQGILFVLLWWRAVKVFVLHGSPFHIGVTISEGREDNGRTGRKVHRIWIGDTNVYGSGYEGRFWYGAVFRAHSSSDKLMRSRLELLILALPFEYTLHVQESRIFFGKDGHETRAKKYRLVADKYAKIGEQTKPDRFRSEVVRQLRHIGQHFENENSVKRIDGFNWRYLMGGKGFITDDFNHRLSFEQLGNGKFKVSELGPNRDGEKVVNGVNELRAVVKADFQAVWGGDKKVP